MEAARAAIEPLFTDFRIRLWKTLCRVTRNPAESEDLVQDVFYKLCKRVAKGKIEVGDRTNVNRLGAYLFRMAANAAIDLWRQRHGHPVVEADASEADQNGNTRHPIAEPAAAPALPIDDLLALREAIQRLKPGEREVVELRGIEGWTLEDIALHTHRSISSVSNLYNRSIIKLRAELS
jgi:RNA polymerase sigma factor (sigma-70 family)